MTPDRFKITFTLDAGFSEQDALDALEVLRARPALTEVDLFAVSPEEVDVPYVLGDPVTDAAAVERAAEALYKMSRGQSWPGVVNGVEVSHVGTRLVAEKVLRAAGRAR